MQGRAGVLPGIGMSASTTWNDNTYSGPIAANSNSYGAELRQPLFNRAPPGRNTTRQAADDSWPDAVQ